MGLCGVGCLHSIAKWVLVLCFLAFCIQYWLNKKQHLTSGEEIAAIVKKYSGKCKNQLTINCLHSSHANDMQYTSIHFISLLNICIVIVEYIRCVYTIGLYVLEYIKRFLLFGAMEEKLYEFDLFFKYWVSACRCITRKIIPLI